MIKQICNEYGYLAVDNYGNKFLLDDIKQKTIKDKFYGGSVKPIYMGDGEKIGYWVGQGHGNEGIWVSIYSLQPAFKRSK